MTELILGTAQFGSSYGITNASGRLEDHDVSTILATAADGGIRMFDTAPDYGDAQQRLGRLNAAHSGPRYVSKFSLPERGELTVDRLCGDTLSVLGVSTLHGLLFHRPADLRDARSGQAWRLMQEARDSGAVSRIGASIYDADDLAVVTDAFEGIDLIQLPGSIVDRRLLDSPVVRALHDAGVEIHVRSAYLQGLLLVDPGAIPEPLAALRAPVAALRAAAEGAGASVAAVALGFLARHPVADAVLVGATSAGELQQTISAWSRGVDPGDAFPDPALTPAILDPRNWPAREAS